MHRLIRRSSAPMLVSGIALIAALEGPALAAHQASGKDPKVNLLTFSFQGDPGSSTKTLLGVDGLTIRTRCDSKGSPVISASTSVTKADLLGHVIDGRGKVHAIADDAFHRGSSDSLVAGVSGDADASGSVEYEAPRGKVVTVNYAFDNSPTLNASNVCTVYGSAISN